MKHDKLFVYTLRSATFLSLFVLLTGWSAIVCSWCAMAVDALSVVYLGYSSSFVGGIIGAVWAFLTVAFIGAVMSVARHTVDQNNKRARQTT